MSFNDTVPLQLMDLKRRQDAIDEKLQAIEDQVNHYCDCAFCGYINDDMDTEELEAERDKATEELEVVSLTLARLTRYAKDKGIELPGRV